MRKPDARHLLGGYATGTLTKSEREALMRAVLEDSELFEEFVEEEDWRVALSDEPFRQRLLRRLRELQEEAQPAWSRRLAGLLRIRWVTLAGAVAALAVIVLIRQGVIPESSPIAHIVLGPGTIPALRVSGMLEEPGPLEKELETKSRSEPPADAQGAAIGLDRTGRIPKYQIGDRQRIGFSLPAAANVLLIEERVDGSEVRLFPNRFQSSSAVKAYETILVPPAGQGDLVVEAPAGPRRLRLLLFPEHVDPLAAGVNWEQVKNQARLIEKQYEVRP